MSERPQAHFITWPDRPERCYLELVVTLDVAIASGLKGVRTPATDIFVPLCPEDRLAHWLLDAAGRVGCEQREGKYARMVFLARSPREAAWFAELMLGREPTLVEEYRVFVGVVGGQDEDASLRALGNLELVVPG